MEKLSEESHFIPLDAHNKLHLKRIYARQGGEPVFLLHGSIEDGRIFYSKNLKGLAPYLAKQGYDVFIGDMQGRGKSTPAINKNSAYGQVDVIKTDIPMFLEKIKSVSGHEKVHCMAHSWGGVLMLSYLARFQSNILSLVMFGTKRRITVRNWQYLIQLGFYWHFLGTIGVHILGYLSAVALKMGSDNEPKNHYRQINKWLGAKSEWIDNEDGFDYGEALKTAKLPPCLFLAGKNDVLLGNPKDVLLLQSEVGRPTDYWLLSKKEGFKQDYDHINMLTHPDAAKDTFPKVVEWLQALNKGNKS